MDKNERVYRMTFASVYPHYITKAEKKGRTKVEVDEIMFWLVRRLKSLIRKSCLIKVDY